MKRGLVIFALALLLFLAYAWSSADSPYTGPTPTATGWPYPTATPNELATKASYLPYQHRLPIVVQDGAKSLAIPATATRDPRPTPTVPTPPTMRPTATPRVYP